MQEFECEICGDQTYRGRREFERHFKEWRHQNGMRALGIPNNKNFYEITKIQEALELWQNIQVGALVCEVDSCADWLIVRSSMENQNAAVSIFSAAHCMPLHLESWNFQLNAGKHDICRRLEGFLQRVKWSLLTI